MNDVDLGGSECKKEKNGRTVRDWKVAVVIVHSSTCRLYPGYTAKQNTTSTPLFTHFYP